MTNIIPAITMLLAVACQPVVENPYVIAHRGLTDDSIGIQENTIDAVENAFEHGADGVELDFWMTSDGQLVCNHDADLSRVQGIDGITIAEHTRDDLRDNYGIPGLDDMLVTVMDTGPDTQIYIELKGGEAAAMASQVVEEINASGIGWDRVTVIGYGVWTLAEVERLQPELRTLWIRSAGQDVVYDSDVLTRTGVDGISVNAMTTNNDYTSRMSCIGYDVNLWNVRPDAMMDGVLSITTDYIE